MCLFKTLFPPMRSWSRPSRRTVPAGHLRLSRRGPGGAAATPSTRMQELEFLGQAIEIGTFDPTS